MIPRLSYRWCGLLLLLVWGSAVAGGSGSGGKAQFEFTQLAQLAKGTERALAAHQVRVALVARIGRPTRELPEGIEYTHVGLAVYSVITTDDGRQLPGYAIFNLYQDDDAPDRSYLRQDYPIDYFAAVHELETAVLVPVPRLQDALLKLISSDRYQRLHNPRYAVLANPFESIYQNCTGFILDILFAAIYNTDDPARIRANVNAWFAPMPIRVSAGKLALGALLHKELRTDDHHGTIQTATFGSIGRFLAANDLLTEGFRYRVDPITLTAEETRLEY